MPIDLSPNMTLPIPTVGEEPGPDYATDVNDCLTLIDQHDHTPGNGVAVTPSGLDINSDLTFQSNNAKALRTVRFTAQAAALALATDLGCVYVAGADLYFNDTAGNQVRITQSGSVAGSPGSISNLVAPASCAYVGASTKFVFQSAANTAAHLDGGSVILRNITLNSYGLTLAPPTLSSDYTITLPAIPASTKLVTMDTSGNLTASGVADESTLTFSGTTLSIKASGVGTTQIAAAAVTTAKLATNLDLPGTLVKANSKALVVSNTAVTKNIAEVHGTISSAGAITTGAGYTVSHPSTGVYNVTFTTALGEAPTVVVCSQSDGHIANATTITTTGFTIRNFASGSLANSIVYFIAKGQQA